MISTRFHILPCKEAYGTISCFIGNRTNLMQFLGNGYDEVKLHPFSGLIILFYWAFQHKV